MQDLRIGVVGAQGRGAYLAMIFNQHPRCRVAAVADVRAASFEAGHERFERGGCVFNRYDSLDAMLVGEPLDWVFIASPDRTHYDLAMQALAAGRNVFVEKPLCQTLAQGDALCRAARESGRAVVVGFELRYAEPVRRFRALLREGAIGRLAHGTCIDSIGRGYTYFLRDYRQRRFSGGLLLQKGIHSLDLINDFVDAAPTRVFASGGRVFFGQDPRYAGRHCRDCDERTSCPFSADTVPSWKGEYLAHDEHARDQCVHDPNTDVEDHTALLIDYANGARVTYSEIHFTPDYKREFTFVGTEGRASLLLEGTKGLITLHRRGEEPRVIAAETTEGSHFGADTLMRDSLVEAALRGERITPDAVDGRAATALAAGAVVSIDTGLPFTIPPAP